MIGRSRATLALFLAAGVLVRATDAADRPRFRPGYTLEQATQVRTLGQFDVSADGTQAVGTVVGYYFGFPVIPRFGEANNLQWISLTTGEQRQLTSGPMAKTQPRFAPAGDRVAFEAEGDVWVVTIATGAVRRVTIDLASDRDAAWSPDGRQLAFVSTRGGQTDLWAASVDGERHGLVRLTNDTAVEQGPAWSPDGRTVAFAATRTDEHFYASGLYAAPAAGGTATRLTAVDATNNAAPRWAPDGQRLAFLSDRGGYTHVWTMAPDGTGLREYDTGPHDSWSPHFAVRPIWSRDGRRLLVSVNREGSFDLAAIDVPSGRVEVLAGGGGQYHEAGWSADGGVVYSYENAWSPPDLHVRPAAGGAARQLTFSSHASFRPAHVAKVERVRYTSADGTPIHGFLLSPSRMRAGERLPAIVNFHTNSYGQFYDHWSPYFHYLVESGYVMLLVDHRGSAGYGRKFREAGIGTWGSQTLEDVRAAAAFIRSRPSVDPARVGAMGLSNGAYMTLIGLTKAPDLFQAGVDLMGAADRHRPFLDRNRLFHIAATPEQDPDLFERISPITSVREMTAPILIIHAERDVNVEPGMTYNFVDELERQGKAHEVVVYPGEAHGLADPRHQLDSYRRILDFFNRYLQP